MAGHNKLLLPLAGKTVIAHTIDHLLQSQVTEIIVVLGFAADQVQAALAGRNLRFVMNPNYLQGMSTSIIAGVKALHLNTRALLISLGDLPWVTAAEIDKLISAFAKTPHATIAVPVFQGQRGNPVIFAASQKAEMLALQGDAGCKSIVARHLPKVVEVEMEHDHILRDVDTIAAYQALLNSSHEAMYA